MSHITKLIALKQELLNANIGLDHQAEIVEEAYFRASLHYLFNRPQLIVDLTEGHVEELYRQFDMWNKVTPIKGNKIIARIREFIAKLKMQLIQTEDFSVDFCYNHDDCEFDTKTSEAFAAFKRILIEEFEGHHV